jgi:hypothetical protein
MPCSSVRSNSAHSISISPRASDGSDQDRVIVSRISQVCLCSHVCVFRSLKHRTLDMNGMVPSLMRPYCRIRIEIRSLGLSGERGSGYFHIFRLSLAIPRRFSPRLQKSPGHDSQRPQNKTARRQTKRMYMHRRVYRVTFHYNKITRENIPQSIPVLRCPFLPCDGRKLVGI